MLSVLQVARSHETFLCPRVREDATEDIWPITAVYLQSKPTGGPSRGPWTAGRFLGRSTLRRLAWLRGLFVLRWSGRGGFKPAAMFMKTKSLPVAPPPLTNTFRHNHPSRNLSLAHPAFILRRSHRRRAGLTRQAIALPSRWHLAWRGTRELSILLTNC
jgi:hypothetical protein